MRQATESFQPIMWWVYTHCGSLIPKSIYDQAKNGEVKYNILHARERHESKFPHSLYWLEKYIIHDSNYKECNLNENGVTGKIGHYDKTMGTISCYITDQHGVSKHKQFYGDNLALSKCIRYMQELSQAPSWDAYELQLKKLEIQRLKKEVQKLKEEIKQLKAEKSSAV